MTQLHRSLNLPLVALYGTGTILGAGIYALVGKIAGVAGAFAPLAFLTSSCLALFTAYSYSQLVKRFPRSAGEAEYVYQGFKKISLSNLVGWLVAFTGIISAATLTIGFVGYFQVFLNLPQNLIISLLVVALTIIAIIGIKESAWMIMIITLIEISGLVLVCSVGFPSLIENDFLIPKLTSEFDITHVTPILIGAFLAFYAFIGFEDIVNLAEETKSPEKVIPASIFISLALATFLYLLVSLVAVSALPVDTLKASDAPITDMYVSYGGNKLLISAIGLFAIINGVLGQVIMSSRILYGLRHPFEFLKFLSKVHPKTKTPANATLFVSLLILLLTLLLPIETLANLTSVVILIVFSLVNVALILSEREQTNGRLLNYVLPFVATLLNLSFLGFKIIQLFKDKI